ncbi:MAG: hypothetical protein P8Y37_00235 [Anaerolineales bacterium]
MYTTNLEIFKTHQRELYRQADHYRLIKSLENNGSPMAAIYAAIGKILIVLGQSLLNHSHTAQRGPSI